MTNLGKTVKATGMRMLDNRVTDLGIMVPEEACEPRRSLPSRFSLYAIRQIGPLNSVHFSTTLHLTLVQP